MIKPLIFKTVAALLLFVATIDIAYTQVIPYSYSSGRDINAVEKRFEAYQTAKRRREPQSEIDRICGPISNVTCRTRVGIPSDAENEACDTVCCQTGKKVGNCIASVSVSLGMVVANLNERPDAQSSNCKCFDDYQNIRCGPDTSFLGIRCPFYPNACWRKCCREGRAGGRCGGFLSLNCRCYD